MANSITRYPGGKSQKRIQDLVLSYAPAGYEEYRECFCGGAGIFFGICPSKKRWINDKHENLIALYQALRDRPKEFIATCRAIPAQGQDESDLRLRAKFDELLKDEKADPALRYLFHNRTGFAGRVNYDPTLIHRTIFSNPAGWNIVNTSKLEDAAKQLRGVTITCGDFEQVLMASGKNCWCYIDPPYVSDTEASPTSKLYQHSFSWADHQRLADVVRKCPHHVCLSYDDHSLIRDLYRDFCIHEHSWSYCGSTLKKKKAGRELIITNYATAAIRLTTASMNNLGVAA